MSCFVIAAFGLLGLIPTFSINVPNRHVGGLFTGSTDGKFPGLAGLKESGKLKQMINNDELSKVSTEEPVFQ